MAVSSSDVLDEQVIDELVSRGSLDFDSWTLLISSFEQLYRDNLCKITLVYDSFLSEFPLCHGYWKKYAEHVARLSSAEDVVQIYEREVEAVPYSVSAWVDYCTFGISFFEDPVDVGRLFDRGLSFVGKDYLCHNLWDKYIEYEYSHKHWNSLASIYIQMLKFPTKKLHQYYESFKKLVAIWKEGIEFQENSGEKEQPVHDTDSEIVACKDAEIYHVINDLIDPSTRAIALQKYISTGEHFYQRACDLDVKVHNFEQNIRRPYFHVKPLDDTQLQNWHRYLDLVEMEGDFDWVVKLYERCLISCAHYPEFWMRYVDYVESKGGKEIAADALKRATHIFLKNVPEIHLFNAWFKEKMSDIDGAHDAFLQCDQEFGPCFIERIRRKANMERRMGNYASASYVYKKAFDLAAKNRPDTLPMLYVNYARLQYMITDNMEATRQVLLNGIQRVPHSKLLLEELLFFALMHDGARQVEILESVMDQALAIGTDVPGGLSCKDREDISRLYLEFIDSCGSIHDVRRAWSRHLKLFPHLIRKQTTLMKPANAGAMANMVVEGRADPLTTYPAKKLLEENVDKSKQDDQLQLERGNSNQNDLGMDLSLVTKTLVKDECKANEAAGAGLLYQASDERNAEEVIKDPKSHASQEVEVHNRKPRLGKPDSGEGHSLNSQDDKYHREASQSNASTRAGGHDNDEIPSTSSPASPASPQENNATETCNESSCPSTVKHKDPSLALSPEHTSDKEGNQRHFKSSGKSCSRISSPGGLTERLERSLSPRRRNSQGYLDDRRCRERSLSPRRRNSRWQPDDRWQRDRRNRRFSRNQDNSRGQRDGRMQNQNVGVAGNTGKSQNAQQQSNVGYPQAPTNQYPQLPINEQYGNVQNNQLYHNMWQYYNYNQQQLTLQQSTLGSQQLQQQVQPLQLQQQIQNPAQQQYMQTPQQPQQTPPNQQQLLNLPYQQQQLYQQLLLQQKLTNEQPESLQQQFFQQQMYLQPHPQQQLQQPVHVQQQQQTQLQQQDEVYLQQQQQQQQSYQYQQAQQQQYMLYLQQLHQYQQSQQQLGIPPEQKSFQQQQKLTEEPPKELPQIEHKNEESQIQQDNGSMQVDSVGCLQQQGQGSEHLISGALTPDELPEIEGTDC